MKKLAGILPTIELAPRWKTRGYTALANSVAFNKNLSPVSRLVYWYLLIRCFNKDNCFPSYETMAQDLGISRRSAVKYVIELNAEGLIKKVRRSRKTNVYILKF